MNFSTDQHINWKVATNGFYLKHDSKANSSFNPGRVFELEVF